MWIDKETKRIAENLNAYKDEGLRLFATSSFQSQSLPLLHLISVVAPETPITFLNTGFHFPETFAYRDLLKKTLGLNLMVLRSNIPLVDQRHGGLFYHSSDPDYCCEINKVAPLEPVLRDYDVWINGVRRVQSHVRKEFAETQQTPFKAMRYHPLLEWTDAMVTEYIKTFSLPRHPLEKKGYLSIGCEPCTAKFLDDSGGSRDSRWAEMKKTECGLHTELVKK